MNKTLYILSVFIILLAIVASGFGLLYTTGGEAFNFINQYGDTVKIYGDGIYRNDSYFMAYIFRGTDFMVLFLAVPIMIIALAMDIKNNTIKSKLFLMVIIVFLLYYSASISLGVKYNVLHLVYMALFGCSLFASVIGYGLINEYSIKISVKMNTIGLNIFLVFVGLSLFVAWLPDIIGSLINKKSLDLIEVYTTNITYILDMAIISPLVFVCLYNLGKKNNLGYILLAINLNMLVLIGITVIIQSVFQHKGGIALPVEAAITKVGIFVLLAIIGLYYEVKLFKNIHIN